MTISEIVHWVDGKPWDGTSTRFANVTNPATGAVTARVALASAGRRRHRRAQRAAAADEWRGLAQPRAVCCSRSVSCSRRASATSPR